jgi:hypothetical protein
MVENYGKSIEIKKRQLESLEVAVDVAGKLFLNARVEYLDVLFSQRDLMDARTVLIETKRDQLSAIINTYQALGGGGGGLYPIFNVGTATISSEEVPPEASPTEANPADAAAPDAFPPEPKPVNQ